VSFNISSYIHSLDIEDLITTMKLDK